MYLPRSFKVKDIAKIHAAIEKSGLATLVTQGANGPQASHVPLVLSPEEGEYGTLHGHIARANNQWRDGAHSEALAIFLGPDAYVTPTWYATKALTGEVVPTWNYVAVHARGPLTFYDDPTELLDVVNRLTRRHEAARPMPWAITDAPPDYIEKQLKAIVGFRLEIRELEGKWKLSQNKSSVDQHGVLAGLRAESPATAAEMEPFVPLTERTES